MEDLREPKEYHEFTVINAHGGEIKIKVSWQSDMDDLVETFKLICKFLGYAESTINEQLKTLEENDEESTQRYSECMDELRREYSQDKGNDGNTYSKLFVSPKRSHKKKSGK